MLHPVTAILFILVIATSVSQFTQEPKNNNQDDEVILSISDEQKTQYLSQSFESEAYKYGYDVNPRGQFHHEIRGPDGVTYGCYGYVDPFDHLKTTFYLSDGWGYRVIQPGKDVELFLHKHEHSNDHSHHDHHGVITPWRNLYFPIICAQYATINPPLTSALTPIGSGSMIDTTPTRPQQPPYGPNSLVSSHPGQPEVSAIPGSSNIPTAPGLPQYPKQTISSIPGSHGRPRILGKSEHPEIPEIPGISRISGIPGLSVNSVHPGIHRTPETLITSGIPRKSEISGRLATPETPDIPDIIPEIPGLFTYQRYPVTSGALGTSSTHEIPGKPKTSKISAIQSGTLGISGTPKTPEISSILGLPYQKHSSISGVGTAGIIETPRKLGIPVHPGTSGTSSISRIPGLLSHPSTLSIPEITGIPGIGTPNISGIIGKPTILKHPASSPHLENLTIPEILNKSKKPGILEYPVISGIHGISGIPSTSELSQYSGHLGRPVISGITDISVTPPGKPRISEHSSISGMSSIAVIPGTLKLPSYSEHSSIPGTSGISSALKTTAIPGISRKPANTGHLTLGISGTPNIPSIPAISGTISASQTPTSLSGITGILGTTGSTPQPGHLNTFDISKTLSTSGRPRELGISERPIISEKSHISSIPGIFGLPLQSEYSNISRPQGTIAIPAKSVTSGISNVPDATDIPAFAFHPGRKLETLSTPAIPGKPGILNISDIQYKPGLLSPGHSSISGHSDVSGTFGTSGKLGIPEHSATPEILDIPGLPDTPGLVSSGHHSIHNTSAIINTAETLGRPEIPGHYTSSGVLGISSISGIAGTTGISEKSGTLGISTIPGTSSIPGTSRISSLPSYSGLPGILNISADSGLETPNVSGTPKSFDIPGKLEKPHPGYSETFSTSNILGQFGTSGISGKPGKSGHSIYVGKPEKPSGISSYPGYSGNSGTAGTNGILKIPEKPGTSFYPGTSSILNISDRPEISLYHGHPGIPSISGRPANTSISLHSEYPGTSDISGTSPGYLGTSIPGTLEKPGKPGTLPHSVYPGTPVISGTSGISSHSKYPGISNKPGIPDIPSYLGYAGNLSKTPNTQGSFGIPRKSKQPSTPIYFGHADSFNTSSKPDISSKPGYPGYPSYPSYSKYPEGPTGPEGPIGGVGGTGKVGGIGGDGEIGFDGPDGPDGPWPTGSPGPNGPWPGDPDYVPGIKSTNLPHKEQTKNQQSKTHPLHIDYHNTVRQYYSRNMADHNTSSYTTKNLESTDLYPSKIDTPLYTNGQYGFQYKLKSASSPYDEKNVSYNAGEINSLLQIGVTPALLQHNIGNHNTNLAEPTYDHDIHTKSQRKKLPKKNFEQLSVHDQGQYQKSVFYPTHNSQQQFFEVPNRSNKSGRQESVFNVHGRYNNSDVDNVSISKQPFQPDGPSINPEKQVNTRLEQTFQANPGLDAIGVQPPSSINVKPFPLSIGPDPQACPCYLVEPSNSTNVAISTTTTSVIGQFGFIPVIFVPYCPGEEMDSNKMKIMFPSATPVPYACNACSTQDGKFGATVLDINQLGNVDYLKEVLSQANLGFLNVPVKTGSDRRRNRGRKTK